MNTSEVQQLSVVRPASSREPPISCVHKVRAITGSFEVIDDLAAAWRQLCDESPDDQPFYRPEFIRAYVRAFVPKKTLTVIVATERGRLDAVLPLVSERALFYGLPVRRLRSAANVHSCYFDLVRRAGPEGERAVAAVWRFLRELPAWDVMEFERVTAGGEVERLLHEAQGDGFPTGVRIARCSPYLSLAKWRGSNEGWLQSLDRGFRKNLRRSARNLSAEGEVCLHRVGSADDKLLQTFYDLECAGWKGKEGTAIACDPTTAQFYAEIAQATCKFGYLCCYFLKVNERVAAAQFGLEHRGRYYLLKPAYDETLHRHSPGHLLVHSILTDLANRGLTEFDFLAPWAEWKGKWTSVSRPQSNCYVFRKGFYGQLLERAKFSLVPAVKSIVAGHSSSRVSN